MRLQKIHRAAIKSVGCPMGPGARVEAQLLVNKLGQVRSQLKEVQEWMEDIACGFAEYSYLLTIPGFGPYVASTVLAAIGNPWRFDSACQLLKLAGYDLSASRSRDFINYFTGLLGGRELERGIKTKMRVKLAAKMLRIAWALMKKKQVFNPDYLFIK